MSHEGPKCFPTAWRSSTTPPKVYHVARGSPQRPQRCALGFIQTQSCQAEAGCARITKDCEHFPLITCLLPCSRIFYFCLQRRAAVVEQFRRDSKSLEDLDLDSSSSDEEPAGPSNRLHPVFGTAAPSDPPLVSQGSRAKQKKGKKAKDKYSKFANLLAWGEYLSAEQPPPEDILSPPPSLSAEPSSFLAKYVPKGKRCLLLSYPVVSRRNIGVVSRSFFPPRRRSI